MCACDPKCTFFCRKMRAIPQHAAAPYMQVRGAVTPNTHRQISRQRSGRRLGCLGVVVVCSNTLTREARQKKIRCKPMHFRSVRPGYSFVRFRPEFDGDDQGIANDTTSLWGNDLMRAPCALLGGGGALWGWSHSCRGCAEQYGLTLQSGLSCYKFDL